MKRPHNFTDLTGRRFGRLVVQSLASGGTNSKWHCVCDCGAKNTPTTQKLKSGATVSCGCKAREASHFVAAAEQKRIDLVGRKIGHLTVIRHNGGKKWQCRCVCGAEFEASGGHLRRGVPQSCGCKLAEHMRVKSTRHGFAAPGRRRPEYTAWRSMRARCHDPMCKAYSYYGARGIRVCMAWRESFEVFLRDIGERPSKGHSLGRINNDRGYEPGNVRWETIDQQARNKRSAHMIVVNGERVSVTEAAAKAGVDRHLVFNRLHRGWSPDRALSPEKGRAI